MLWAKHCQASYPVWGQVFSSPVQKYRELLLSLWRRHWRHTLKFHVKVIYVMGKALSGELSCMGTGVVVHVCHLKQKMKITA